MSNRQRFGESLVRAKVLDRSQLEAAMAELGEGSGDLGEHLVKRGLIQEGALLKAIGRALEKPVISLADVQPDDRALGLVPRELCVEHLVFPVELERTRSGEHLHLAMANPFDMKAIKQVTRKARRRIRPLVALAREIRVAIARVYGGAGGSAQDGSGPRAGGSPVDMFDFEVTDLSSLEDGVGGLGLGGAEAVIAAAQATEEAHPSLGPSVEFGRGGGGGMVELDSLPSMPSGKRQANQAPRVGTPLYSTPPGASPTFFDDPPAPDPRRGEDLFEHGERPSGGGLADFSAGPDGPFEHSERRPGSQRSAGAASTPGAMFEHSERRPGSQSRQPSLSDISSSGSMFEHSERLPGSQGRASRPSGDSSGASIFEHSERRPGSTRAMPEPEARPRTPPTSRPPRPGAAEMPTPRGEEEAGAGMMIRRRRRPGGGSPQPRILSPEEGPPLATPPRPVSLAPAPLPFPPRSGPLTPAQGMSTRPARPRVREPLTPADGLDMRRLFERMDGRDDGLATGDDVIGRYLERYGAAPDRPQADAFLLALEKALDRAGSPTATVLLLLIRRLARAGLLDPEELLADLTRR